jgi:hypothetical protein
MRGDIDGKTRFELKIYKILETFRAKNQGYSPGGDAWRNFRECESFGVPTEQGVMVRMSDKWMRLVSLIQSPDNDRVGESIIDTLEDLSVYSLILACIIEEKRECQTAKPMTRLVRWLRQSLRL